MPCIENWQKQPLAIVQNIFENRKDDSWPKQVQEYFESRLASSEQFVEIPSLNDCPLHELQSGTLVRFRCMIQDTYDNEFFLETYDVIDNTNGVTTQRTSCYQDVVNCPNNCKIDMNSNKNRTGMRQIVYCISVPGETTWVKEGWKSKSHQKPVSESQNLSVPSQKRGREDDGEIMETESSATNQISSKRIRPSTNGVGDKQESSLHQLKKNHPLPDEDGPVCLVKVYDETQDFKVNEVMEFVGILCADPSLSSTFDSGDAGESAVAGMETDDLEEKRAHHPPASIVPRLHVVTMRKLQHLNPLLSSDIFAGTSEQSIREDASSLRNSLLGLLEKATLGDSLAAEYLLLHLIARVYSRRDMLALGQFSLNISGIPPHSRYPLLLAEFLKNLVTKLYFLPMKLDKINSLQFTPTKNYSTNRLDSGLLQLPSGSHLVLDEGALEPGRMDPSGVKNIQAFKNLLVFQKVDYNFQFHEASFETDVQVLILSEGKSMLPCDCQVQIKPSNGLPQNLDEYFASFAIECSHELLNKCRRYINTVQLLDYALSENMTKCIQDDFVAARKDENAKVTADDLHGWLVIARLLSLSVAQAALNAERWEKVKTLEKQRKERLVDTYRQSHS